MSAAAQAPKPRVYADDKALAKALLELRTDYYGGLCVRDRCALFREAGQSLERHAEADLVTAGKALLAAFDAFTGEVNWGESALSAATIAAVNAAPLAMTRAIEIAERAL